MSRNLITTFIAFCLAATIALFAFYLQKPRTTLITKSEEPTQTNSILVSKSALNAGDIVELNNFEWQKWPTDSIDGEYYRKGQEADLSNLKGAVVRYAIAKGAPLKRGDILTLGDKSIVTAFVSPHKRAVSIPLSHVDNPSVHYSPGDFVDILLPTRGKQGESQVNVIIKGVKVIAVDEHLEQAGIQTNKGGISPAKTITVETDPQQAKLLAESIFDSHIVISQYSAFSPPSKETTTVKVQPEKGNAVIVLRGNMEVKQKPTTNRNKDRE